MSKYYMLIDCHGTYIEIGICNSKKLWLAEELRYIPSLLHSAEGKVNKSMILQGNMKKINITTSKAEFLFMK